MNNKARLFIGLQLSGYLVNIIPLIKSTINDKKDKIKWINGKNLHLTLSFLGNIKSDEISKLKKKLSIMSDFNSFDIMVNGTGAFPSFSKPKILWLDINKGRDELISLQAKIENIANPFKENKRNEEFTPHITIGRIKDIKKNTNFNLSTFSNTVYSDIRIPVKTIYLFKSELLNEGVEYSIISKYLLNT